MPTKYDASGGNSKANRCDDFISAHRIINHPSKAIRSTMQISIQKVKDKRKTKRSQKLCPDKANHKSILCQYLVLSMVSGSQTAYCLPNYCIKIPSNEFCSADFLL